VIRGIHVLALATIALGGVALRATEVYTSRYQTLPVLDWLESRPPLAQAIDLPAAGDLARGLPRVMPLLVVQDDAHTRLPAFSPPASIQRTLGGVRDASRIQLGSPGTYMPGQVPITARLDVIVFNRQERAAAWSELMRHAMDIRDPETGLAQVRVGGGDEPDATWLPAPGPLQGGIATVAGYRGPVGFVLQVSVLHGANPDAAELVDASARAETIARTAAHDWAGWLQRQLEA